MVDKMKQAAETIPENSLNEKSLQDLKGKLLYVIFIPQLGLVANCLLDKAEPQHWIVLDCIRQWQENTKARFIRLDDERYVWINYGHLLESLPVLSLFGINSKAPLTRILQKLEKLGLIETHRTKFNQLYARLTTLGLSLYWTDLEGQEGGYDKSCFPLEETRVSPREKQAVSPREKHNNKSFIRETDNKKSPLVENMKKTHVLDRVCLLDESVSPLEKKESPSEGSSPNQFYEVIPTGKVSPEGSELLARYRKHVQNSPEESFDVDAVLNEIMEKSLVRTNGRTS
jgi:hypothetical protein